MKPTRYILPAEMADATRRDRNRAAAALVATLAALAAAAAALIQYAHP